jgi:hypothetical protein
MKGATQPFSSLCLSVLAIIKVAYGDAALIDEDVLNDVTTVFVFQLKASSKIITVSVGLEDVSFVES